MLHTDDPAEVGYVGQLSVGDMTTALGFQIQAPYASTDYLWSLAPAALGSATTDIKSDANHRCVYPAPVFVPHNQTTGSGSTVDADKFLLPGIPGAYWDIDLSGSTGAIVQCLQDPHWRHQTLAVTAGKGTDPRALSLFASCQYVLGGAHPDGDTTTTKAGTGGDAQSNYLRAQEVEVWISRSLFGGVGDDTSKLAVIFEIGGYRYAVAMSATATPAVTRSTDGGDTYGMVKTDAKGASADAQATGDTGGIAGRAGEMLQIRASVFGGRVSITAGGGAVPIVVAQGRDTRTAILNYISESAVEVPAGSIDRLPPMPFEAQAWDGSGAPQPRTVRGITVTGGQAGAGYDGRDVLFISGDMGGIRVGGTIDILDPRITKIELSATGFSHLSFAAHVKKFAATATFQSPLEQTGFYPSEQTPPYYTLCGCVDAGTVDSGGVFLPFEIANSPDVSDYSSTGAQIFTDTINGSTLGYTINIQNPVPNADGRATGDGGYPTYAGASYADETVCLTSATVRVNGLEKPAPQGAYVNCFLGVGGRVPVKSVSESISFEPGALTISHTADVELDNTYGVEEINRVLGVGVTGNVGVAVRLGYDH